jgi:hypothetical protein
MRTIAAPSSERGNAVSLADELARWDGQGRAHACARPPFPLPATPPLAPVRSLSEGKRAGRGGPEPTAVLDALWQLPAVDVFLRAHRTALGLGRTWSTEVRGFGTPEPALQH